MPGVPRIMYLDFPFQIFQTPQAIAIAFEWSLVYRLIYTDGSPHPVDIDSWMGDSRGRWDGDTLVVDVGNNNDKTWFDMAGDFHSDALHVVERYRMTDPDTIQYEATIEDSKVFTKPWTIGIPLHRRTDRDRLFEYVCQAEAEEENGAFTREERTWYPGNGTPPPATNYGRCHAPAPQLRRQPWRIFAGPPTASRTCRAFTNPTPEARTTAWKNAPTPTQLVPPGRGIIVDPPDGKLPMQPWAVEERTDRQTCPNAVTTIRRRTASPPACRGRCMSRRRFTSFKHPTTSSFCTSACPGALCRLDGRAHLPDTIRLWQGDSVGRWEGDTLVVDTTNFNGKTWLNEGGEVVSYAEHVVERFTPVGPDTVNYEATITDPVVYTRPWTIAFPLKREKFELTEAACHEEDHDLPHLKALKDAAAGKK